MEKEIPFSVIFLFSLPKTETVNSYVLVLTKTEYLYGLLIWDQPSIQPNFL